MPTISTRFTLAGEKEYRQAISDIGSNMRQLDAEMRKVSEAYKGNEDSTEALSIKYEYLGKKYDEQKKKVESLREALQQASETYGAADKRTKEWQLSLTNAETALIKIENEIGETEKKLVESDDQYAEATERLAAQMKLLDSEMRKVSTAYGNNASSSEALEAKNEVLNKKIDAQKEKVELLRKKLHQASEEYGEADKKTQEWAEKLNNAEAELNELNNAVAENNEKMQESEKETGNLGDITEKLAQKFGISLPDGMKESLNGMGALDTQSIALAVGLAGVTTAIVNVEKALISMTREAASAADDIATMSSVTGVSTETLQAFAYSAELTDVSVDRIADSLKYTTKSMAEAATGTGEAYEAYRQLGVAITDSNGNLRSAEAVFYDTIDALGKMENGTERDATAMKLMSKSAQELNPLISAGSEVLKGYAKEAQSTGYILDDKLFGALLESDDAFQRLQKTQEAVKKQLAAEFAPYLTQFYSDTAKATQDLGKVIRDSGIVDAFGMLLEKVGGILNPMDQLSNYRVPALTKALRPLAEIMAGLADTVDFVSSLLRLDFKGASAAAGFLYSYGTKNNVQTLNDKWTATDTNAATLSNGYGSYYDSETGKYYGSLEAYANAQYEALWESGDKSISGTSQAVWVEDFIRKLRGNASGTDNWPGGFTRVGENGPEAMYLPAGTRITSASETRYGAGDIYIDRIVIDAKNVREFEDVVQLVQNWRVSARMGVK